MTPFDVISTPLRPGTCSLIEANAGTGKTFNIQHLYLRLILEQGLEPARILVVTFTEAATAELRDRIRQNLTAALALLETGGSADTVLQSLVNQARNLPKSDDELRTALRLALAAFDEAAIFTIHGFCKRTLDRNAFDSRVNFDCELCPSYTDLMRELVTDFYRQERASPLPPAVNLKALIGHANKVMGHIGDLTFEPDQLGKKEDLWFKLTTSIAQTQLPARSSKFKQALAVLKQALNSGNLHPGSPLLDEKELIEKTANNNAPEFVKIMNEWLEAPIVDTFARLREFIKDPEHGFEARKSRLRSMGFDDLLRNMQRALLNPDSQLAPELRKSYAVAMVDEFQDTDPVQYKIFETVFKHPESMFFMIGDPKQAIYGFRGGDIYAYLKAKESVAKNSRFTLSHNYRSSRKLIEAINHLFTPDGAFAEAGLDYHNSEFGREPQRQLLKEGQPDEQPFEILWFSGDADGKAVVKTNLSAGINRECAARIAGMLMGKASGAKNPEFTFIDKSQSPTPVMPGDIAVLVTKHNEAKLLQQWLRQNNVPAVIYKSGNVFQTDDAKNLWHVLAAMVASNRPATVKAALLTPLCGLSPIDLILLEHDSEKFEKHITAFAEFDQRWRGKGIMVSLAAFLTHYQSFEKLAQDPACERRLTNLRHLSELLHQAEASSELEPDGLLNWFKEQITKTDIEDETHEQRMESDRTAVTIMTIHKSKGLQFPIVFIPYLITHDIARWLKKEWTIHEDTEDGEKKIVFPVSATAKKSREARRMEENLAEDLRLLYVAVTRAENRCVIMMGNIAGQGAKSAVNYLGQLHTHAKDDFSPSAFITTKLEAGPESPFNAASAISTTNLSLEELGAHMPNLSYSGRGKETEIKKPLSPPTPINNWGVMSYSGMTQHAHIAPAHMKPDAGADEIIDAVPPAATREILPGGINTGLCVHAIFEKLDFTRIKPGWKPTPAELRLINSQAGYFGLYTPDSSHAEARRACLRMLITNTLNRMLSTGDGSVTLSDIAQADTRREWEFFFNVPRNINLEPFKDLGLTFKSGGNQRQGFMTGSIDLLFRQGERYFFADWKTDTLGDYSPAKLAEAMVARNYTFQGIVYAVALHNLLKQSFGADYDFQRHFGGGYYLFVRGITATTGVHVYQPQYAEVEGWDQILRNT
ncbi:MAG: UvrD-helicase domain-containing protein [Kiritimatiellia bacterium]